MTSNRIPQSNAELCEHLKEQVSFLRRSAASYDDGFFGEAKRLAVVMRVLLHDTAKSTALLSLLQIKSRLRYYDRYAGRDLSRAVSFYGVGMEPTPGGLRYSASLTEPQATSEFSVWWGGVAIKQGGKVYRRSDIILAVANMDGGAHVDPTLEAQYAPLSRQYATAWSVQVGDSIGTIENGPQLPVVRQCAYELELTIIRQVPQLLGIVFD